MVYVRGPFFLCIDFVPGHLPVIKNCLRGTFDELLIIINVYFMNF